MTAPKKTPTDPVTETVEVVDGEVQTVDNMPEKPRMKRRDLLYASALLRRHKMDPTDPAAMSLAIEFVSEKKNGETEKSFQEWLDEDIEEDEEDGEVNEDGLDPTAMS